MKAFFLFSVILSYLSSILCELKFVYEAFRHGARSPWAPGNKGVNESQQDIFGEYWLQSMPGLESELTNSGIRQQYLLGHKLRTKYVDTGFLDKTFNITQLVVISTNVNRTIMSAQSHLFGLYPPTTGPQIKPEQALLAVPPGTPLSDLNEVLGKLGNNAIEGGSQVFPVHLFDEKYEGLWNVGKCPAVEKVLNSNDDKDEIKNYKKAFNDTYFTKFQKVLGYSDPNYFNTFSNIYIIGDTFACNYFERRTLQKLVDSGIDLDQFYNETLKILRLNMIRNFGDHDAYVARIGTSSAFRGLFDQCDWVIEQENKGAKAEWLKRPKFLMHSVHDTTLFGLQRMLDYSLNTNYLNFTVFASNLLLEFNKLTTKTSSFTGDDFYVSITINDYQIYNNTYTAFKSGISKHLVEQSEIENYCDMNTSESHTAFIVIIAILAVVVIVQIIVIIILVKRKNSGGPYEAL